MAHQELVQLQRYLGLVEPGVGESVEDVVFVCIDIEAFEFKQEIITEIGVSVLDSRSVRGVDPGDDGKAWFDLMKHLHLRPVEHKRYVNKRFVKGCADDFNFGESVEIKIKDAGRILDRVFSDPNRIHEAFDLNTEIADVTPSIMLVGHDLKNDTDYLKRLDFTTKHVAGKIDTQRMARISKSQSPGLSKLLTALSIDAKNLHNAGNDAAYTLQALVSVAVQEHRQPGNTVKTLTANKELLDAAKAIKKAEAAEKAKAAKIATKASDGAGATKNAEADQQPMGANRPKESMNAAGAIKKAEAVEKSKAAKIARKTSDGAGANKNVNSAQQPVGGNRAKKSMNSAKAIRKIPTDEKITTTKNATGADRVRSGRRSPELKGISKVRRPDSEARDPGAKIPRSVGKVSVKGKPMRRVVSSRPESAATPENAPGKIRPNSRNSTSSSGANGENSPTVGKAADQSNESRPGH